MKMATKQEIIKDKLEEYLRGGKQIKGMILDELASVTKMHRQAIIRRINVLAFRQPFWQARHPGRRQIYGLRVTEALRELWEMANNICAERLHPQVAEYVSVLKRCKEWNYPADTTKLLLAMSLGTMKDRLEAFPRLHSQTGFGSTKPSAVKELVSIRISPWDNPDPGYGEVDTVAHCGTTLRGDFAYTVQYTDVSVLWVLLAAQWNKGMLATKASLVCMQKRCPFKILSFDFDSGGEFINQEVIAYLKESGVAPTRIRPGRKNDHGRIEQKNYANIRNFVGYSRYDNQDCLAILNSLWLLLEDYINFFLPSAKCIRKERIGSKYRRIYDPAKTAYARVLAHPKIPKAVKRKLKEKYVTLNPKRLKAEITRLQHRLYATVLKTRQSARLQ